MDKDKKRKYLKIVSDKSLNELSEWNIDLRKRKFDPQNKVPKEDLEWLIKEIEKEFVLRFERGDTPMDLPTTGLLAVMGYHVGIES